MSDFPAVCTGWFLGGRCSCSEAKNDVLLLVVFRYFPARMDARRGHIGHFVVLTAHRVDDEPLSLWFVSHTPAHPACGRLADAGAGYHSPTHRKPVRAEFFCLFFGSCNATRDCKGQDNVSPACLGVKRALPLSCCLSPSKKPDIAMDLRICIFLFYQICRFF